MITNSYIFATLGHQGASASFPSLYDLVSLDHLRNHSKSLHTPESCDIPLDHVNDVVLNYAENVVDDQQVGKLKKKGKDHLSVICCAVFPIKSLDNVVVPTLHVTLGSYKVFCWILEKYARAIDQTLGITPEVERKILELEQRERDVLAEKQVAQSEHEGYCKHLLDIQNVLSCLEIVEKHKNRVLVTLELQQLAKNAMSGKKGWSPKKSSEILQFCGAEICPVTKYDTDSYRDNWVMCDSCVRVFRMKTSALSKICSQLILI